MRRAWPIIALFILSGAAGLIYEVVWARQLVLVFGNTTQAVSAILTGFFGGMALGSYVGGRVADRARRALLLYGCIELLVAIVALATPWIFSLIGAAYGGLFGSLETAPLALGLVRFLLSLAALGPATVLLGATLPTLTRYLARERAELSGAFGQLYTANTVGAVVGAAAAGLALIELLGLEGALQVGAACSAGAGLLAIALHLRWRAAAAAEGPTSGPKPARPAAVSAPAIAIGVAFVSGFTSLAYQTLWTRLISAGTGNLTYVFTLILTVFLIGLALGAATYVEFGDRFRRPIRALAILQAGTAVLALLGLLLVLDRSATTTGLVSVAHIAKISVLVVLPTTFVMGLSLPLASSLVGRSDAEVGEDTGRLLAANTVGAILATFGIPFLLIPLIGSPLATAVVALVNGLTALTLAWLAERPASPAVSFGTTGISAVACVFAVLAMMSGGTIDPTVYRVQHAGGTIEASLEDEIAAVQAGAIGGQPMLWVAGTSMTALTVDSRLMPLLPLMLRPNSQTALTVAFGMGSAYREALAAGLRTDAVELVPSVPRMFHFYFADAAAVMADPRGRIVIADGRNYVDLTDRRYDIIVVDPPPPVQSSGASVISSLEFYQDSSRRLTAGGVMMQWVPLGQTVDDFRDHVRTFAAVFPHVLVAVGPGRHGYFLLGSAQPIAFDQRSIEAVLARPGIVEDLSSAYDSPVTTAAAWSAEIPGLIRLAGPAVDRWVGPGPLVTDDHPLPEYYLLRSVFGTPSPALRSTSLDGVGS